MLKQAVFKFPAEQSCVKFQPVIYKPKYTWNVLYLKTQQSIQQLIHEFLLIQRNQCSVFIITVGELFIKLCA